MTIIELLLQYGADPNKQENHEIGKNTPFHKAVEKNLYDACSLFMNYGGDPTIKNKSGFSCLHIAARDGRLEIAKLLVASGVEVAIRDNFGFNPSYWAKQNNHHELLKYLGEPLKVTKEEFYDHMQEVWKQHDFKPSGKGKKKKGGKGKKKK
jgi:ankyrin repeat protein